MSVREARYETKCGECDGIIRVGAAILPNDGDDKGTSWWRHEVCPPGAMDLVREVCSVCFTEKSVTGACLCEATS